MIKTDIHALRSQLNSGTSFGLDLIREVLSSEIDHRRNYGIFGWAQQRRYTFHCVAPILANHVGLHCEREARIGVP